MQKGTPHFIGVDVGTGSVRAGIFGRDGNLLSSGCHSIKMWNIKQDFYEQSSEDIWSAVCFSIHEAMEKGKISKNSISGIGFDATCSLVALDAADNPVSLSPTFHQEQNVIVWMDHRAIKQAHKINQTNHHVLKYVGGKISPEMQCPKLLWIKENLPESWKKTAKFFDLADFLTYKATGHDNRSLCTVTCKWTFQYHASGWDISFFREIGLLDLETENFEKIGNSVKQLGDPVGQGLHAKAAQEFGLKGGTPVGAGIIDAHAGGIGCLGTVEPGVPITAQLLEERLALIAGTSACHMAVSRKPLFVDGIWGPYYGAMIPGMWLTEGGQSAVGSLIDRIIYSHPSISNFEKEMKETGMSSIFELLNEKIAKLTKEKSLPHYDFLTNDVHVLPYFHGNRSPRADPTLTGMITGLTLDPTDLPLLYLATLQALAHGSKHIIDTMNSSGYRINTIVITGGFRKNFLFLEELANITQCLVILPKEDAVLLGSAILGAVASREFSDLFLAMQSMSHIGSIINPSQDKNLNKFHEAKHQIFLLQYQHQMMYKKIMRAVL